MAEVTLEEVTLEYAETEFLRKRTMLLYAQTTNHFRTWTTVSPGVHSTSFNVVIPEDGEDYLVQTTISSERSETGSRDKRWVLTSYETGLFAKKAFAKKYQLTSDEYPVVESLGKLVQAQAEKRD